LEWASPEEAAAEVERFLAQVGEGEPTMRAGALELAVRAHAARGDPAAAGRARDELQRIAQALGTTALAAAAAAAEAVLRHLAGDLVTAASCFEQAAVQYERGGAPFESARARLDLAHVLGAAGQRAAAEREARTALESFQSLGAERDAARAQSWLKHRPKHVAGGKRSGSKPPLTGRQLEILRLVAQGLSNPEIAVRLRLSDHTVKRHVANLLTKLGLPSRAAAVAYAALEGLL